MHEILNQTYFYDCFTLGTFACVRTHWLYSPGHVDLLSHCYCYSKLWYVSKNSFTINIIQATKFEIFKVAEQCFDFCLVLLLLAKWHNVLN